MSRPKRAECLTIPRWKKKNRTNAARFYDTVGSLGLFMSDRGIKPPFLYRRRISFIDIRAVRLTYELATFTLDRCVCPSRDQLRQFEDGLIKRCVLAKEGVPSSNLRETRHFTVKNKSPTAACDNSTVSRGDDRGLMIEGSR